uniref:Uncharacterized protein n=1 Tax=Pseudo-nitzschia multiseries DNA virus TaxID=2364897 RepID=A0A678W4U7_9VIRU|nr:hypothetical protein PmDNAV1_gp37 [Pseudo-nitzschia multiseries DNA virus]
MLTDDIRLTGADRTADSFTGEFTAADCAREDATENAPAATFAKQTVALNSAKRLVTSSLKG